MGAHLIPSPSRGIIYEAIVSVFIPTVSVVAISIILHNSCVIVIIAASISVIVNYGLILDDSIIAATIIVAVFVDNGFVLNEGVVSGTIVIVAVVVDDRLILNYSVVSTAVSTAVAIIIVDEGLILNNCIPTTAAIPISTVITTLFISIMTTSVEVIFKLVLVSVPVLLCRKTKILVVVL